MISNKFLIFYFIAVSFITVPSFAQTEREADSIINVINDQIYQDPDHVIKVGKSIYNNTQYTERLRVMSLMVISDAYSSKRDYQNALKYFLKANELSGKIKDKKLHISILTKTAIKYQQLKVYDKAIQYLDEAQKLAVKYPDEDSIIGAKAMNYIVRGFIYKEQLNCDLAIGYFDKGINECLKDRNIANESTLSIATYNKGNCYLMLKNYDKAEQSFNDAIEYANNIKANSLKAFALKGLAQVYTQESNNVHSIEVLTEAEAISKDVGDVVLNKAIYSGLSDNYLILNDWKNYQKYHKKYIEAQLALTQSERKSISNSIDESYTVNGEKLTTLKKDFYFKISGVFFLILSVLIVILVYQKRTKKSFDSLKERVEKAKKEHLDK